MSQHLLELKRGGSTSVPDDQNLGEGIFRKAFHVSLKRLFQMKDISNA